MADCCGSPLPSSLAEKHRKHTSFFGSPRALFTGITSKGGFAAADTAEFTTMSPTSILDTKPFSAFKNPFWSETQTTPKSPKPENRIHWDSFDSRWVGLGLVDALSDHKSDSKSSKPESRMVLFGSQLKIQIPPLPPSVLSPVDSPKSPRDFGIKTRNSHVGVFSPVLSPLSSKKSTFGSSNSGVENDSSHSPGEFAAPYLSATEMELSEEYTCVISRGPNPRTTHIFDDCIIQSCCGVVDFSASGKMNGGFLLSSGSRSYPSESFLGFCYNCKNDLGLGKDIYMYRGEKAFCSSECRYKEMMLEEEEEEENS